MLDPNVTTLLAALIGGLLSAFGGFLANYYIQSATSKALKHEKIQRILENAYESINEMTLIFYNKLTIKKPLDISDKIELNKLRSKADIAILIQTKGLEKDYREFIANINRITDEMLKKEDEIGYSKLKEDLNNIKADMNVAIMLFIKNGKYNYI